MDICALPYMDICVLSYMDICVLSYMDIRVPSVYGYIYVYIHKILYGYIFAPYLIVMLYVYYLCFILLSSTELIAEMHRCSARTYNKNTVTC